MADFRAFLGPTEPVVLPYFGGTRVDAKDRRFRLEAEIAPGWWRFQIDGRRVVPLEPASPIDGFWIVNVSDCDPRMAPPSDSGTLSFLH